MVDISQR